jgi:hypothetical protein
MPYRIDVETSETAALVLAFQGFLDGAALAALRARITASAGPVRLVLRAGTELDPTVVGALRRLPVADLSAESPYLTLWLSKELP